jgi:transposase
MWYVGLDAHARQSSYCILDENGKPVRARTIKGPWDRVLFELAAIKNPFKVCFEASTGYGYLHDKLAPLAKRVAVAHPGQLRLIFRSKRKNDRVDAEKLAKLLYLDEVPPVYVPSEEVRAWRGMIEHRQRLLAERVRAKNGLRALLHSHGRTPPRRLWGPEGKAWLEGQEFADAMDGLRRDILLERIASVNAMIQRVEKVLAEKARNHPGVRMLMEIPGVGVRTAEAVVAYVDNPHRFSRNAAVGSYFGLVPCQDQSAGKNRLGHITRQGPPTVRKLLVEAAWQGVRRSPEIRAYFERIHQGDPDRKKIAIVATAHHLLRAMHAMLCTGETWRSSAA